MPASSIARNGRKVPGGGILDRCGSKRSRDQEKEAGDEADQLSPPGQGRLWRDKGWRHRRSRPPDRHGISDAAKRDSRSRPVADRGRGCRRPRFRARRGRVHVPDHRAGKDPVHRPELPGLSRGPRGRRSGMAERLPPLPVELRSAWRGDPEAPRFRRARFRGRALRRHRQGGSAYPRGPGDGTRRRLHRDERGIGARVAAPRNPELPGQELLPLGRDRPLDGHHRRGGRYRRPRKSEPGWTANSARTARPR